MRLTLRSPSKMHFLRSSKQADWTLLEQIKLSIDYSLANHTNRIMCFFLTAFASPSIHALGITSLNSSFLSLTEDVLSSSQSSAPISWVTPVLIHLASPVSHRQGLSLLIPISCSSFPPYYLKLCHVHSTKSPELCILSVHDLVSSTLLN